MNKRTVVIAFALVCVAAVGSLGFMWAFANGRGVSEFPGIVEVHEIRLGSKVGGRVASVHVKEGDTVEAGVELVRFHVPELETQKAQLLQRLAAARAEYQKAKDGPRAEEKAEAEAAMNAAKARRDRMIAGWRREEKDQAEADLNGAKADLDLAKKGYERIEKLNFQVSQTEYDTALARMATAQERFNAALARKRMVVESGQREEDKREAEAEFQRLDARHRLMQAGTRAEDISVAEAQMREVEAKLREVEVNLLEAVVTAPAKIVVEVLGVRAGDLAPPNQPIIRALQFEDRWIKIFVPSTDLGRFKLGDKVEVTGDSFGERRFPGTVVQIATIGEFTPRNVQSADERKHQVFGVKVRVDDNGEVFKAGMAAVVHMTLKHE